MTSDDHKRIGLASEDGGLLGTLEHRIPVVYGYGGILAVIVSFQLLKRLVTSYEPPKSVQDAWLWRNLFISWIHALIVGTWDLSCFYLLPEMTQNLVMVTHYTVYSYAVVTFATGYFIYDYIDIILNNRARKLWEVCIHHTVVISVFLYNITYCNTIGYTCVALLTEVNSIFLHGRKLMHLSGVPFSSWLYRLNAGVNIITFFVFRFVPLSVISYGMLMFNERISPFFLYLLIVAMGFMIYGSIVFFYRLIQNDIVRPLLGKRKIEKNLSHNNNANKKQ